MHPALLKYFEIYPEKTAPFMHQQVKAWEESKPLKGLRVVHHVPLVQNTLLKIACLVAAGADVTVTNPFSFVSSDSKAVACLQESGIRYVESLEKLVGEKFDLYFDCGAELYQALGSPKIGAIELTGSGDSFYRNHLLNFPVISIDRTFTKQFETVFGSAESVHLAISQETKINPAEKSWIIFGFGKIGHGLAFFCVQKNVDMVVVDISEKQRQLAKQLGLKAIDPKNTEALKRAVIHADICITATGKKSVMDDYPRDWFKGKILVNMGIYDEYGGQYNDNEVLNHKKPINFVLKDPTPMDYIDPEFYLHNIAALSFMKKKLPNGVHDVSENIDQDIINRWCYYHHFSLSLIQKWFIKLEDLYANDTKTFIIDDNNECSKRDSFFSNRTTQSNIKFFEGKENQDRSNIKPFNLSIQSNKIQSKL